MPLKAQEREVLFGTPILARQLRKYVEGKGKVSQQQTRLDFPDVSINTFCKTIGQLVSAGELIKDEGILSVSPDAKMAPGSRPDAAWKAARILRVFTDAKLAQIAAVDVKYAKTICATWKRAGLLIEVGSDAGRKYYRLVYKNEVRPTNAMIQERIAKNAPKTPRSAAIAKIHIAKQQAMICACGRLFFGEKCPDCGGVEGKTMPEWYYRQILASITDKESCAKMSTSDLDKVVEFFVRAGFKGRMKVDKQLAGIQAEIKRRAKAVLGPDWQKRIDGFIRDIVKKQDLESCTMIEARRVIGWINRYDKYNNRLNKE
jgi:hypothetical protein